MTKEEMKLEAEKTRLIVNVTGFKVSFAGSDELTFYQLQYALHAIFQGMITQMERNGLDKLDALHALRAAIHASSDALMEEMEEEYNAES